MEQPHTEAARRLAAGDGLLIAPEPILPETASAFWKYVRAGLIGAEKARAALSKLPERFDVLSPLFPLTEDAFEIAVSLNRPVYDCVYLALVTADKRLAAGA